MNKTYREQAASACSEKTDCTVVSQAEVHADFRDWVGQLVPNSQMSMALMQC